MLRDEARCCHAWCGVYLKEIDLLAFRDNVVNTDNAVTTKQVVNHRGQLRDALCKAFADSGRCYLVALIIVLGCIVEELIFRDNLRNGEYHTLLLRLIAAASQLSASHESFYHHVLAFLQGKFDCRTKLLHGLDLSCAEGGPAPGRLHKARQTNARHYLLVRHLFVVTYLDEQTVCNRNAKSPHVIVENELVVSHCFDKDITCRVRHLNEVEVTLQFSVLAWSTMNGDVSEVGMNLLAVMHETKVVSIDLRATSIRKQSLPLASMNLYLIYNITRGIDERSYSFCTTHTYVMLRTVTATNYCYCFHYALFSFYSCYKLSIYSIMPRSPRAVPTRRTSPRLSWDA